MKRFIKILLLSIFLLNSVFSNSQIKQDSIVRESKFEKFKPYLVPTIFIGYGLLSLSSNRLQSIDADINNSFNNNNGTAIDDITMALPTLSVYGLNIIGNKGKHNFKERTLLIATATTFMLASTFGLKKSTNRIRPNFVDTESFPSAHTAISFMGAEFLHQEYKHKSIWYGITGYTIATGTAYLRLYNKEHWFSDVVTGAGIGILSTKLAYLINPYLQKKIFKKKESAFVSPFYNGEQLGLSLVKSF
jgi:membrane-associated phospholipid phosphatase